MVLVWPITLSSTLYSKPWFANFHHSSAFAAFACCSRRRPPRLHRHYGYNSGEYVNSEAALKAAREADAALPEGLYEACLATGRTPTAGEVKMIYYTKVRGCCWWRSVVCVFALLGVVCVSLLLT